MKKKNTPAPKKKPVNTSDELNILTNEKTVAATKKQGAFFFFPFYCIFHRKKKSWGCSFQVQAPANLGKSLFFFTTVAGVAIV